MWLVSSEICMDIFQCLATSCLICFHPYLYKKTLGQEFSLNGMVLFAQTLNAQVV